MVSVVGLGGQTLGMASSKGEAVKIARRAIDLGIDFFDNAWDYLGGRAEEWMGEALEGGWREKVFLMTKVCTHLVGMDKMEFVEAAAQASAGPPMSREEREAFTVSVARQGGPGFAVYLREGYRDGDSAIDPGHPA
jgi:aryl-alcohol dehydrogenase-like predicted oxidoreductase